ncbi:MAG: dephospho-CoA kinase [Clostridia bacterium]|nr:dephospho-CoA kinase [Clostridia bacterium]
MTIIGLTGPTGAGKGLAGSFFEKAGIPVIDTDAVYHDLLVPPSVCLDEIVGTFGPAFLNGDGSLNRPLLASYVFDKDAPDRKDRQKTLNEIAHRHILARVKEMILDAEHDHIKGICIDAPLLFESGFDKICDHVVAVLAPQKTRLERIIRRDGIDHEKAKERMEAQQEDGYYEKRSDFVIVNDKDPGKVEDEVFKILRKTGVIPRE